MTLSVARSASRAYSASSPASLLEAEKSRADVSVSALDSDVDEPRRRCENLTSCSVLLRAVFCTLRVMSQMAQQARIVKAATRMWMARQ